MLETKNYDLGVKRHNHPDPEPHSKLPSTTTHSQSQPNIRTVIPHPTKHTHHVSLHCSHSASRNQPHRHPHRQLASQTVTRISTHSPYVLLNQLPRGPLEETHNRGHSAHHAAAIHFKPHVPARYKARQQRTAEEQRRSSSAKCTATNHS